MIRPIACFAGLAAFMFLVDATPSPANAKSKRTTQSKPTGFLIAKHLDMAVAFDAQNTALEAQRRSVGARFTPPTP
jgi:hypothetical protein